MDTYQSRILAQLRQMLPSLAQKYGVTRLGVFGSVARGQATKNSDIDIVYETKSPNIFKTAHLRREIENALSMPVDMVRYREKMNPTLKKQIETESIYAV
jgi:uncharacterized protein